MKKQIGVVGVDSGQIMVLDPCYIKKSEFTTEVKYSKRKRRYVNKDGTDFKKKQLTLSYDGACLASLGKDHQLYYDLGHAGAGVCVGSGYGDGLYPVYGDFDENGRCIRLTVEFD